MGHRIIQDTHGKREKKCVCGAVECYRPASTSARNLGMEIGTGNTDGRESNGLDTAVGWKIRYCAPKMIVNVDERAVHTRW